MCLVGGSLRGRPAELGQEWQSVNVDQTDPITGMSCVASAACVGTDLNGDIVTSTDPTGPATDWTVTQVDSNGGSGVALESVACRTGLCVAGDVEGSVVTSTTAGGGAAKWTVTPVGDAPITAMACPSKALCVGGDAAGLDRSLRRQPWRRTVPHHGDIVSVDAALRRRRW